MTEIWLELRQGTRKANRIVLRKLGEANAIHDAMEAVNRMGAEWASTKQGRSYCVDGTIARLLFSDKSLAGLIYIEVSPPPPGNEPGDFKRQRNNA